MDISWPHRLAEVTVSTLDSERTETVYTFGGPPTHLATIPPQFDNLTSKEDPGWTRRSSEGRAILRHGDVGGTPTAKSKLHRISSPETVFPPASVAIREQLAARGDRS
ncbi:hypothetical protein [Streptomyces sp. NBC_01481]|uniref:hypothetical protein n=1 Tax=Streptomyces sp. NBC_01481 TaxID=2975869 RepID=UPI00224F73CB|nr:hypothetical protein [Streptomyces sp. NBC_01481]MCX4588055.1 hypothetical protein [Streptomyces sp. NBC_01481]